MKKAERQGNKQRAETVMLEKDRIGRMANVGGLELEVVHEGAALEWRFWCPKTGRRAFEWQPGKGIGCAWDEARRPLLDADEVVVLAVAALARLPEIEHERVMHGKGE